MGVEIVDNIGDAAFELHESHPVIFNILWYGTGWMIMVAIGELLT